MLLNLIATNAPDFHGLKNLESVFIEQQWLVGELMEKDPAAANELGRQLDQSSDPKAAEDFWNATTNFKPSNQDFLNPSVMQFASPIAVPKLAKGITDIKLTEEQKLAKADLEKSPACASEYL